MNPHANNNTRQWIEGETVALEGARVTSVPTHTQGDNVGHSVEVVPDTLEKPVVADVRLDQVGDVCLPSEGDRVIIGHRLNGRPHVLGTRYAEDDTIPEFEPGERVIGHPASASHVRFAKDGTIRVEGDGGNTVVLQPDGSIVVNGGNTQPVMDVTTSKDADGHVTSISLTRADNVYLPSQ